MIPKTKILTISSNSTLLKFLEEGLDTDSYEISATPQTGLALKRITEKKMPDFIILDIMMPNLDGISVCLQLRQWTQTPILMLSTWGAEEGMVRGLNLNSESYLTEPFSINEVKRRIVNTMQRNAHTIKNIVNN
jgi:DNA-binding response OmpR family regulator